MPEKVISNTSPIFYFHRIGNLELLKKLYNEIVIPEAVVQELEEGRKQGEDVPNIDIYQWIHITHTKIPPQIRLIPDLGKGESEVLALALEEKQHLVIIDDKLARGIAKLQNIKFTGTAGILLKSKKVGLILQQKNRHKDKSCDIFKLSKFYRCIIP